MSRPSTRHHGQAPRGAMLHPMWQGTRSPSNEPWVGRCLLGSGWVACSRRLSVLDLRLWAAFGALLQAQVPEPPADDPSLANADTRTVHTTGYQLADMVLGDDSGHSYRRLSASMLRLATTRACVHVVEPDPELALRHIRTGYVALLGDIWDATLELQLRTPREWGALSGHTSLRVEIGRWSAQQIVTNPHGSTWIDLDLLRALGSGLPARMWPALESWASWPQRSMDGREESAIGLAEPARQSLGVGEFKRPRAAREALNRAGARIVATDPSYELIRCERRAGWCLVIRRLSGARARAQARSGAPWRSPGIAATKRARPERAAVRAAAAESLATAQRKRP